MQKCRGDLSAALVSVGPAAGRVLRSSELEDVPMRAVHFFRVGSLDEAFHGVGRRYVPTIGKREVQIQHDRPKRQELGKEQELDVNWL